MDTMTTTNGVLCTHVFLFAKNLLIIGNYAYKEQLNRSRRLMPLFDKVLRSAGEKSQK